MHGVVLDEGNSRGVTASVSKYDMRMEDETNDHICLSVGLFFFPFPCDECRISLYVLMFF